MSKSFTNEFKTGLFVIVCAVILMVLTVSVGKFNAQTYKMTAVFNKVAGLDNDAPVRLSGVEVGKVESVKILYKDGEDTKVAVTMLLVNDAKMREGAKAYVTTLGLMGEKYVELTPGAKDAPFMSPCSTIIGEDPIQMEELVDAGKQIAAKVDSALTDISTLTKHLDEVVVNNKEGIDGIVDNLNRTTSNLEEFSADIKRNPWKLLVKGKEDAGGTAVTTKGTRR